MSGADHGQPTSATSGATGRTEPTRVFGRLETGAGGAMRTLLSYAGSRHGAMSARILVLALDLSERLLPLTGDRILIEYAFIRRYNPAYVGRNRRG